MSVTLVDTLGCVVVEEGRRMNELTKCRFQQIDMTPPNVLEQTLKQLVKVLRSPGCRKQPVFVKDLGQACELAQGFVEEKYVFRHSTIQK